MFNLGLSRMEVKDYRGAEELFLACQAAVASGRTGIDPYIRDNAVLNLIELYDAWDKPAEAEKWLAKLPAKQKVRVGLERHYAWPLLWGWPRF